MITSSYVNIKRVRGYQKVKPNSVNDEKRARQIELKWPLSLFVAILVPFVEAGLRLRPSYLISSLRDESP